MCAIGPHGENLDDPEFLLDRQYLRQVVERDGARLRDGMESGAARPLLTCAVPLSHGERGMVVIEAAPESRSFASGRAAAELEECLAGAALELTRILRIEQLEARLRSVEGQLQEGSDPVHESEAVVEERIVRYRDMVTNSPLMVKLFGVIDRIKNSDLRTLVVGETGTGKELIARALHFGSFRESRPFEVVSCGSLSLNLLESELFGYRKGAFSGADEDRKGIFERAHGGTVFLDEVADMPPEMQQKVLRVLQEKVIRPIGSDTTIAVDIRVVSSTRKNLARLVREKKFRNDLYYRLNEMTIDVPPLRDRPEDIHLLLHHFLRLRCEEEGTVKRFSESAERELCQYSWAGNVTELRNVVTRAFLATTRKIISRRVVQPLLALEGENLFLGVDIYQEGDRLHLAIPFREGFNEIVAECEKLILLTALRRNRGNKSRVTQQLKIPRQTLYNKLEKYEINPQDYMEQE